MIHWLLVQHQFGVAVFLLVLLAIALSNLGALRRLGTYPSARSRPRASILLPARNEERNIRTAVEMLLAQEYPDFELLVLDDESTDRTPGILADLARESGKLRVLRGEPLPAGWMGKAWACHQLAQAATGELLLFTDADTRHGPQTLAHAVNALAAEDAGLVSAVPRQEVKGWAEKLAVPIVTWSIMAFLPLRLAVRWYRPAFTAANGQFLLFRRQAYGAVGGHRAVRDSVVEDLSLVRRMARQRLGWRLLDAQDDVSCRMYRSTREVVEGFTKNLYSAFGQRLAGFAFVWLWLALVTFQPLVVVGLHLAGAGVSGISLVVALVSVAVTLALWSVSHVKFRFPLWLVPLYPVHIGFAVYIAGRSACLTLSGRASWKGRPLTKRQVK